MPNYEVVPLKVESFTAGVVQFSTQIVDPNNPKPRLRENVKHAVAMIHAAIYGMVPGAEKNCLLFQSSLSQAVSMADVCI